MIKSNSCLQDYLKVKRYNSRVLSYWTLAGVWDWCSSTFIVLVGILCTMSLSLVLESTELHRALQMQPHRCLVEGEENPTDKALSNATQDILAFFAAVLVSAETVNFPFIVSVMMLCFGLRRKTVLVIHHYFSCCWAVLYKAKDILVSQLSIFSCQQRGWRGQGSGKGQKLGSCPKLTMGIFHLVWHHARKTWKTERSWLGGQVLLGNGLGISWWVVSNCLCITSFVYVCI